MKNPLLKRLPREFLGEIGKYLVIFIFMVATIGFISGYLVSDSSMIKTYNEADEKYNIEDGNFELYNKLNVDDVKYLEEKLDIALYENFYIEEKYITDKKEDATIRVFKSREDVNKADLLKGKMPAKADEIAIDRLFANNNNIKVGDRILVGNTEMTVSGFIALSDYSALFENNNDVMFDSVLFSISVVTEEGFLNLNSSKTHFSYSWLYNGEVTKDNEVEKSEELIGKLYAYSISTENEIANYIPKYDNQSITFAGNDMGKDKSIMIVLLYILIAILAFVFAVTTNNTITKESSVIGTLRASGYTKGEILRHYISLPIAITFIAAIIGNILGYTIFKDICVENIYYGSYSLTTYKTIWSAEAFLLTTVIPLILMLVINVIIISGKLSYSPLQFLRHDLSKKARKRAIKLPDFKFLTRFRLRVIIQNRASYLTLFVGILFANMLLIFGEMLVPLLNHYSDECLNNMICKYQYILKSSVEVDDENAEKYAISELIKKDKLFGEEEVMVYGVEHFSKYIGIDFKNNDIYISNAMADKYDLKKGDEIKLFGIYDDKKYTYKIAGIYNYPSSVAIFMPREMFCEEFDKSVDFYNGYFSDDELDIDDKVIASIITKEDLTKITRQLNVSMGEMIEMVNIFALVLFVILIYLLTKIIIEKNANAISMAKILGYTNGEINKIYLFSTSTIVVVSTILSLAIDTVALKFLYKYIMSEVSGWIIFYMKPSKYIEMFVLGMVCYIVVMLLQVRKIRRIPMTDALKNVE